jgi:hypothetical protein
MTIRGLNFQRTLNDTTYYVHDATGNVMGIYVKDDLTLTTQERPIYGSSRLGIINKDVKSPPSAVRSLPSFFPSLTDYYPFGYPIASRTFSIEPYRYGFNGQEGDNEVYGDGKSYTAEYWQYDSRLGRRWNVDPVITFWESPYATFANNPVMFRDILGADTIFDDNIARQAFRETYSIVLNQVKKLENEIIDNKFKLIFDENLTKRQIKKIKKQIEQDEEDLYEWKKLEDDFNDLLNSKVLVHYNSKTDLLGPNDMGMVTGGTVYGSGEDMTGDIYVSVRPNYDDYYIHEDRHICQVLQGTQIRKLLDKERESYTYQGVFNPNRIIQLIENAKNLEYQDSNSQYYNPDYRPFNYGLDDAIKYIYKKEIKEELENENNK